MGKYNFNYTAIQELKNENEKLKAEKNSLESRSTILTKESKDLKVF